MPGSYTVAQITNYIKNMFTQDFLLNKVCVSGEISNCKYHSSGHIYFTLKDAKAQIPCVMFASDRRGLGFKLEDGQSVEISGRIDIYERDGRYQLYANRIRLSGEGALFERFNELKRELEERGMFAPEYKVPIPKYVRTLGVVTAQTGAAVQDIINIATRRNPFVQIILYPALVQGEGAAASIVAGIQELESRGVDVMIVGRGGGSIEDLWAFNEEIVAQAIFDCSVPIISAVGHETDFTISDFVADLRAPTPSAAAELAVCEASRLFEQISRYRNELNSQMYEHVREARKRCESMDARLKLLSPVNQIRQKKMYAISLEEKLNVLANQIITGKRHKLDIYISAMKGLSPLDKLNSGYSVALDSEGKKIRSVSQAKSGDMLSLFVSDGRIETRVEKTYGSNT